MSQCHALNAQPPYARCEEEAGHDGEHRISLAWSDEECFDPSQMVVTVSAPVRPTGLSWGSSITDDHGDIQIMNVGTDLQRLDAALEEVGDGECFSCGCSEAEHTGGACERHDCRAFVP